jgi:hypothetical protein
MPPSSEKCTEFVVPAPELDGAVARPCIVRNPPWHAPMIMGITITFTHRIPTTLHDLC